MSSTPPQRTPSGRPVQGGPQTTPTIESLCSEYLNELVPSFSLVEKLAGEDGIPIQFYTEIRAATTHLGRVCQMSESDRSGLSAREQQALDDEITSNLEKAKRHLHRVKLDCQKWCCVYFEDATTSKLEKLTKSCTLRLVNDGEYLKEARRLERQARERHRRAKREDSEGTDRVMDRYIDAVSAYDKLYDHLFSPSEETRAMIAKLEKEQRSNRRNSVIWVVAGFIVAVIGLFCNFH